MATKKTAARFATPSRSGAVNVRSSVNGMEIPLSPDTAPKLISLFKSPNGNDLVFDKKSLVGAGANGKKMKIGSLEEEQSVDVSSLA